MADLKDQGLVSLDEGGWEVAEGDPYVRGWDVLTADQRKIGEVDDLSADPTAMKVRYLTIQIDKDLFPTKRSTTFSFQSAALGSMKLNTRSCWMSSARN